jgi:hypothetical protein
MMNELCGSIEMYEYSYVTLCFAFSRNFELLFSILEKEWTKQ